MGPKKDPNLEKYPEVGPMSSTAWAVALAMILFLGGWIHRLKVHLEAKAKWNEGLLGRWVLQARLRVFRLFSLNPKP